MYRIKTDSEKNRMILVISGYITKEEVVSIKESIAREVNSLKPGFDIINDVSNFRLGQNEAGMLLKSIISFLKEHKVSRIVRVVGASQIAVVQFATYSQGVSGYDVKYLPTMEEAINYLETKEEPVTNR